MSVKQYAFGFLSVNFILLLLVIVLNFLVDSQGLINLFQVNKLNKYKVVNNDSGRTTNSVNLSLRKFDIVVTGTSRVQSGIDPRSKSFGNSSVYNASLGDTDMQEQVLELEYILEHQPSLKHLIIGLDFHTFSSERSIKSEYYQSLFYEKNSLSDVLTEYFISLQSLKDIKTTLLENQKDNIDEYWIDGHHHHDQNKENSPKHMRYILEFYMGQKNMFGCFRYDRKRILALQETLSKFASKGIKVSIFISPQHAKNLMMLEDLNLFSQYYRWIKELTVMTEELNQQGKGQLNLWDFSGFNSITTEPIPRKNPYMKYYYETSHYKDIVGDYIIQTVLEDKNAIFNFGKRLDSINIDKHILKMKEDTDLYKNTHSYDMCDLKNIFEATQKDRDNLACYKH